MARNQAPIAVIRTDWSMLWANTEVMCDLSPPAVASPLEMVTLPWEKPQATSTRIPKRNQYEGRRSAEDSSRRATAAHRANEVTTRESPAAARRFRRRRSG